MDDRTLNAKVTAAEGAATKVRQGKARVAVQGWPGAVVLSVSARTTAGEYVDVDVQLDAATEVALIKALVAKMQGSKS